MDNWRKFIHCCESDLIVRRWFEIELEEPSQIKDGIPVLPPNTMRVIKESDVPMVAAAAATSAPALMADMDVCVSCADEPSMDLVEMKCCKKTIHRQCILAWLAVSNQCVHCQAEVDTVNVADYPVIPQTGDTAVDSPFMMTTHAYDLRSLSPKMK